MDHLRKKTSEHIQWPEKGVLTSSKFFCFSKQCPLNESGFEKKKNEIIFF